MSIDDVYRYHNLPPNSKCIRILDILPGTDVQDGTHTRPLVCKFKVIDLDTQPQFTALSYVWGKDAQSLQSFIICNGVQIPVTANCQSALKHLYRKLGHLRIWVDAVCIKQDDLTEKAQQIPLMGSVYSNAESVFLWLGEGTCGTDRAMRYLNGNMFEQYFRASKPTAAAWIITLAPWIWKHCPLPLHRKYTPL
jgi:hypothetical protein